MPSAAHVARLLTETLQLDTPPVALRYVTSAQDGIPTAGHGSAPGCAHWRKAETATFFAPSALHKSCPVGMHTQGLSMDGATSDELMGLIGQMATLSYLDGAEVPAIPTVPADRTGANGGIVEGPLAELPVDATADAVLLWVNGVEAMLLNEAFGGATWGAKPTPVYGRPACAAIPAALSAGQPALSLGCAGMRAFTEISGDKMLAVIPGVALDEVSARLATIGTANAAMDQFYAGRKATLG